MQFIYILCAILIITLIAIALYHVQLRRQLDYTRYANKRLEMKLRYEKQKSKMNDIPTVKSIRPPHNEARRVKQSIIQTINRLKDDQFIKDYKILSVNQIVKKNKYYSMLAPIDFVVITNIGLILIKSLHFDTKTFVHYTGKLEDSMSFSERFAHQISANYHRQFHESPNVPYTFSEVIEADKVTYQFYKYDPLMIVEKVRQRLSQQIEMQLKTPITIESAIFNMSSEIQRSKQLNHTNVAFIENESGLTTFIKHFSKTSHSLLDETTINQLEALFTQKH